MGELTVIRHFSAAQKGKLLIFGYQAQDVLHVNFSQNETIAHSSNIPKRKNVSFVLQMVSE